MTLSIFVDPSINYPDASDFYSPDQYFPEYKLVHISKHPNPVYRAVRNCLAQSGLDRQRFDTPEWNPLGIYIKPGSQVFVLCNFVYHRNTSESQENFWAKCTHGSVLRALVDYILLAVGPEGYVNFGNAPLQSCDWKSVLHDTGASKVLEFYQRVGSHVSAKDLRAFVSVYDGLGREIGSKVIEGQRLVEVNLGQDSLLSFLYTDDSSVPHFRVSDYDPQKTAEFHSASNHRYVIHRDVLDSDVVISLTKIKTHEKVGITCGLKGFVGMVGHKHCLAHHRVGSPKIGGDEYPYPSFFRHTLSKYSDWVYRIPPSSPMRGLFQVMNRTITRMLHKTQSIQLGAWYGNDTAWRMALDLARIAHFADSSGVMHSAKQRKHLVLVDGIVGGEGNGPLKPEAVHSGTLVFGNNVAFADQIVAYLMGFDPGKIAIVREAFMSMKYPLVDELSGDKKLVYNGKHISLSELPKIVKSRFKPPYGWVGKI